MLGLSSVLLTGHPSLLVFLVGAAMTCDMVLSVLTSQELPILIQSGLSFKLITVKD